MKTSRFTDEQRVRILREADKMPVREVIKKHSISEPTFYAWRRKFGGMDIAEAKKLRALEAENGRLKKLLAESHLECAILKEVAQKNGDGARAAPPGGLRAQPGPVAPEGVPPLSNRSVGARVRLEARRPRQAGPRHDARAGREVPALRLPPHSHLPRTRGPSHERRARTSPLALGEVASAEKTAASSRGRESAKAPAADGARSRLGVRLRLRRVRRRQAAQVPDGRRRVDARVPRHRRGRHGSIRSGRVIEVLARLASVHGAPRVLRSDNGPEFVSTAVLRWLADERIDTAHIDPGKPWQNGTDESFNGRFREECLDLEWFRTREEARVLIEAWRVHYNAVRPHSSLDYLTPDEFKRKYRDSTTPTEATL
jgi:putative transposase